MQMHSELLAEWMAFDSLEPFGPLTGWWQTARLMAHNASLLAPRRGGRPYEISEFMPDFEPKPQKTPAEVWASIRTWALLNGAKRKEEGGRMKAEA